MDVSELQVLIIRYANLFVIIDAQYFRPKG